MRYIYDIAIWGMGLMMLASCEDVIDLELDNTDPRVVVEALADINTSSISINVTLTNDFYEQAAPNQVTDAEITLKNEAGDEVNIPVNSEGSYSLSPINLIEGEIYELEVIVDGISYTAETTAPFKVPLLGIDTILRPPFFQGGDPFIQSFYRWFDNENQDNFYRLRTFVNDTIVGPYAFYSDNQLDGELFVRPLMAPVFFGDTARFQLISIDKSTYDYFIELQAVLNQGFGGTTPFNPKGNFDNNALGYFGISSYEEIEFQF